MFYNAFVQQEPFRDRLIRDKAAVCACVRLYSYQNSQVYLVILIRNVACSSMKNESD